MLPSLGLSVFINGDSRKQIKSKISPSYNSVYVLLPLSEWCFFPEVAGLWGQKWDARPRFWWTLCLCLGRSLQLLRGFVKRWWGGMRFLGVPPWFLLLPCPLFASVHLPMSHRNPSFLPRSWWLWKQARQECGSVVGPADLSAYCSDDPHTVPVTQSATFHLLSTSPFWVISLSYPQPLPYLLSYYDRYGYLGAGGLAQLCSPKGPQSSSNTCGVWPDNSH